MRFDVSMRSLIPTFNCHTICTANRFKFLEESILDVRKKQIVGQK